MAHGAAGVKFGRLADYNRSMAKPKEVEFPLLQYADELVDELRGNVSRALNEWDAGAIHKARVATRRLKSVTDLMNDVIPAEQRKPFAQVTRKLRRRLGPLRDLDVMIDHLNELSGSVPHARAMNWLRERLIANRLVAREESKSRGSSSRVLARLGTWWGLREEVARCREAVDSLLAESLHLQLDAFAERADALARRAASMTADSGPGGGSVLPADDPHALRIAGKQLRYTLEMAAIEGHRLPAAVMRVFKRMQEELGLWHDYVVLSERAMQVSLEVLLPHHDATLQAEVLELAKMMLKRSARHLASFSKLWATRGEGLARVIRNTFPLTRDVTEPKTDPGPTHSSESSAPAASPPDATSGV